LQFNNIVGQNEVKLRLRNAFKEGRLAHAIMLLGPEGNGSFALAMAFAQFISCANRTAEDSCGQCPTCHKISALQFADMNFTFPFFNKSDSQSEKTTCDDWISDWRTLMLANPYSSVEDWKASITKDNKQLIISVAEAVRIIQRQSLRSYEGGYKFQIIWLAEYLKTDTANKLLKILEEPPEKTVFILICNNAENILPTILSRVQSVFVPKVKDDIIAHELIKAGQTQEQALSIAHFADGNWNKALQLANAQNPDAFFAEQFQLWMRMCYSKNTPWLIGWSNRMHDLPREEQKHFLTYALEQIRQNLMLNYVGEELARMNENESEFSKKFAPFINDLNAEDLMDELSEAHADVARNAYSKLVFMDLSLKLHYLLKRK
jgi:DNA polymerase III subunit delta'